MLQHLGQTASIAAKTYGNKDALIFDQRALSFSQ